MGQDLYFWREGIMKKSVLALVVKPTIFEMHQNSNKQRTIDVLITRQDPGPKSSLKWNKANWMERFKA